MKKFFVLVLPFLMWAGQGLAQVQKKENCDQAKITDVRDIIVQGLSGRIQESSEPRVDEFRTQVEREMALLKREAVPRTHRPDYPGKIPEAVQSELMNTILDELAKLKYPADDVESWISWTSASVRILERELANAGIDRRSGNLQRAYQTLRDAIFAVAYSVNERKQENGPLTQKLVVRGLILSTMLDMELPSTRPDGRMNRKALISKYVFLSSYVRFIVNSGAFDRRVYIPRVHRLGLKANRSGKRPSVVATEDRATKKEEQMFLRKAGEHLAFAFDFATVRRNGKNNCGEIVRFTADGHEKLFLKVAEFQSRWVAHDVSENYFGSSAADCVNDLNILAAEFAALSDDPQHVRDGVWILDLVNEYDGISKLLSKSPRLRK